MRWQPHDGFSVAIRRMSARSPGGTFGLPMGRDFQRQTQRTRSCCQRTSVAGRKMTSELRQAKNRDSITSHIRSRRRARRGAHAARDNHGQLAAKEQDFRKERDVGASGKSAGTVGAGRQEEPRTAERAANDSRYIPALGRSLPTPNHSAHQRAQGHCRAALVGEQTRTWRQARREVPPRPGAARRSDAHRARSRSARSPSRPRQKTCTRSLCAPQRFELAAQRAWTLSTSQSLPVPWQVAHASEDEIPPKLAVLR